MRKLVLVVLAAALLAGGFLWGFFTHRNHVFPYWTVKTFARPLGLTRIPAEAQVPRHELWPEREEALRALPYVAGTADPEADRSGVVLHDRERAEPGLNLYSPVTEARAYLADMEGRVLHEWARGDDPWQHVELLPDGGLLATVVDKRLLKLDRRSRLVWEARGRFHHSLDVDGEGRIYTLTRLDERIPEIHPRNESVVDSVTVLSPGGQVVESFSLPDVVRASSYAYLLPALAHRSFDREEGALDVLHTNHVEVFDGRLAGRSELFARGNLLVSFRTLSAIAILDGSSHEVLWLWGPGNLSFQHHPTLLDDGHILVFDNGTENGGRSQVVELDPLAGAGGRVVWRYAAADLFSRTRGSAQRLPGGNTLVTESDTGYVFEVTPAGERVWIFANPHFTPDGRRMALWWMTRYPPEAAGFLSRR